MKKIIEVFPFLWKGKQKLGFKVENLEKPVFINAKEVIDGTGVFIDEVEILAGSYLKPIFFQPGERLSTGRIFQKGDSKLIKSFDIIIDEPLDELRSKNKDLIKDLKIIEKVFQFTRNGKTTIGLDVGEDKSVFIASEWLYGLSRLNFSNIKLLEGSYVDPEYFSKGENIYEGMDKKAEYCRKSGVILKNLNLRIDDFEIEHKELQDEYLMSNYSNEDNSSYDVKNWLEDVAGSDDPEVMNDAYWNLD